MRPQSAIVKTRDFGQGVEAAAMSVASEILKLLQVTKDSEIGICAENAFQLRQIGDLVTAEMLTQGEGSKEVVRIMLELTLLTWNSENHNIIKRALTGISIASFEPVEPISEAGDWTSLIYWTALDVGVNPINVNLLLRGPLVLTAVIRDLNIVSKRRVFRLA
jgi:hypothetical protein